MIELSNICKTYRVTKRSAGTVQAFKSFFHREYTNVEALKNVSFKIDVGEIVGYIGPNGAGKSTTIKVMCGILVPDNGSCVVNGYTPWKDRKQYVRSIGVVFGQRSQLWWDVPVIDSFQLLKDIYKITDTVYKRNVDMLFSALDISGCVDVPTRQLSLGQRMRCEIAASLLHDPQILFLDEPTIGLDAVSKLAVRNFIKTINKEKKVTVVLTTHDMNDIEALTEKIMLIGKGSILYNSTLPQLRALYSSHKIIKVNINENISSGLACYDLKGIGITEISKKGEQAGFLVDTNLITTSKAVERLSKMYDFDEISIENEPIENVIVKLYEDLKVR